ARHADVHAADETHDSAHRRTGMPDPFESMSARADDDRRFLTAGAAPAHRGEIVRHDLQRVQQVIEILNLRDRTQSAQRGADRLSYDRALANAGIGDEPQSEFFLETGAVLIHVAELADVFADDDDARLASSRL